MNTKKILKGIIIFAITLIAGFTLTAITFNLADELTRNQMRLLFSLDIITLLFTGGIVFIFSNSKKVKEKREKELEERHNKRIQRRELDMKEINIIVAKNRFAA